MLQVKTISQPAIRLVDEIDRILKEDMVYSRIISSCKFSWDARIKVKKTASRGRSVRSGLHHGWPRMTRIPPIFPWNLIIR
jgi:hypothetical protein